MNAALNQAWAAHIEKWRLSGLSAKAFCEQEGLVYHQFGYWRQKFLSADDAPTGSKWVPVTMTAESHHTTSLEIETAKANGLEPSSYLQYLLDHIAQADTLEALEALLPWNMSKAG